MALDGWDAKKFMDQFDRDALNARKRAGRKIGAKNIREAKKTLGKVSSIRKKQMKYKVFRTGTLVHRDVGPDARSREYGSIAKAKPGHGLRINLKKEYRKLDGDFVAAVNGRMFLFEGEGEKARPIALIAQTIKRKAVDKTKRLSDIAEGNLNDYVELIEKELIDGR